MSWQQWRHEEAKDLCWKLTFTMANPDHADFFQKRWQKQTDDLRLQFTSSEKEKENLPG